MPALNARGWGLRCPLAACLSDDDNVFVFGCLWKVEGLFFCGVMLIPSPGMLLGVEGKGSLFFVDVCTQCTYHIYIRVLDTPCLCSSIKVSSVPSSLRR